ncbi:hypothetical protein LCGC14_2206800, partial [marine sediment metagenome]
LTTNHFPQVAHFHPPLTGTLCPPADKFGPIDKAGDAGDLAGTQKIYDEMIALFKTLEKYAPDHDEDDD